MKTLIKLIVAAVVVNATYRCGSVALKYYQFKDETQQMILFGQAASVTDLTRQILGEAMKREVPLDEEGVEVIARGRPHRSRGVVHREHRGLSPLLLPDGVLVQRRGVRRGWRVRRSAAAVEPDSL